MEETADTLVKLSQVKELERLAEQLNSEVSLLNLEMPANYDWKVVTLVQKVNKRLVDDLDRLMTERCP